MGIACALLVVALFSGFTLVSRLGFTRSPLTLPLTTFLAAMLLTGAKAGAAKRLGLAPAHAAAIVAVLSCLAYLPFYAMLPDKALWTADWQDILIQAGFQGVLLGVVSIFVYTQAVASLGAQETALFTAAVPCLTTVLAVAVLGEMPSTTAWTGVAVVTAGMAVALRGK